MVDTRSLFQSALVEAERHKYIESEKVGSDVGLRAIHDWHQRYWTLWLRHRWLEHLLGQVHYEEFAPESYGALRQRFGPSDLLAEVIERVRYGAENIDVLTWATREGRDLSTVIAMLIVMRVNDIRCTRFCFAFAEQ
jgi:hypothetical protein